MSLILDALNKADREREPVPAIPTIATSFATTNTGNNPLPGWVYAIAGALAVSVVVMLVLLLKIGNTAVIANNENTASQAPLAALTTQQPAKLTEETPVAMKLPRELPAAVEYELQSVSAKLQMPQDPHLSETVAGLYGNADLEIAPENNNEKERISTGDEASESSGEVATEHQEPIKKAKEKAAKPLVSDAQLAALWREAQQETAPLEPQQNMVTELPYLHQLPESFQERIPTLMYQNHIFSARASAVIINGATYKKGDFIADQLKIEAITEEDLVLSYLDKPFKLAALSSWVKMN